jgi:hypothetical protein
MWLLSCTIQILFIYYFIYNSILYSNKNTRKRQRHSNSDSNKFQRISKHKKSNYFQKHFKLCENGLMHTLFKCISSTKAPVVREIILLQLLYWNMSEFPSWWASNWYSTMSIVLCLRLSIYNPWSLGLVRIHFEQWWIG